jgi:peroxiredoxin
MIDRVMANLPPVPRPVPDGELGRKDGSTVRLRDLIAGRPTLLILWDRRDGKSSSELRQVEPLLMNGPARVVWVSPEPHGDALDAFVRSTRLSFPPYHDSGSQLAMKLGEWTSRAFFVIDGSGQIRTRTTDLMEAVRLLEVLSLDSRGVA